MNPILYSWPGEVRHVGIGWTACITRSPTHPSYRLTICFFVLCCAVGSTKRFRTTQQRAVITLENCLWLGEDAGDCVLNVMGVWLHYNKSVLGCFCVVGLSGWQEELRNSVVLKKSQDKVEGGDWCRRSTSEVSHRECGVSKAQGLCFTVYYYWRFIQELRF